MLKHMISFDGKTLPPNSPTSKHDKKPLEGNYKYSEFPLKIKYINFGYKNKYILFCTTCI